MSCVWFQNAFFISGQILYYLITYPEKEKEKIIKKMLPRQSSRPSAQQMSLFVFTSFTKALRGTSPVNSNQQFSIEII
jgi:hypothetical protein